MASLRTYNRRKKYKRRAARQFHIVYYLDNYSPDFSRGYFYVHTSYKPGVGILYDHIAYKHRWTPKNPITYYTESVRYAGHVVMDHTKYYRRLFRERNPQRWKAYL